MENFACNECKICFKKFDQKRYLKAHIKTHAPKTPVTCTLCDAAYTSERGLKIHMMAVHKKHNIMKIESVGFMILDEDASKTPINTDTPKQVLKQETQNVKGKEEVCENCEKSF